MICRYVNLIYQLITKDSFIEHVYEIMELLLGKKDIDEQKQDMVVGNKGTRQEWMEEEVAFTMDYHRVRRRRPIHNKQVPVAVGP